jgi:hypothetical protein
MVTGVDEFVLYLHNNANTSLFNDIFFVLSLQFCHGYCVQATPRCRELFPNRRHSPHNDPASSSVLATTPAALKTTFRWRQQPDPLPLEPSVCRRPGPAAAAAVGLSSAAPVGDDVLPFSIDRWFSNPLPSLGESFSPTACAPHSGNCIFIPEGSNL